MSKLARALALAAMLAATNLAGMTAVAHAHAIDQGTQAARRPPTDRQVEGARRQRPVTSQEQSTGDAALRRLLARERFSIPNGAPTQVTSPRSPTHPRRQAGWRGPALWVLAPALALVAGVAVLSARHAKRTQRAGQTA
jgi:hypothetical protein